MTRRLILASASAARLDLLRGAGFDPEVIVSGVDEDDVEGEAGHVALTLSQRKATAVAASPSAHEALVLGCDSVLELAGEVCGKPGTADEAIARWKQMRGACGFLHTGHCVIDGRAGATASEVARTFVRFGAPSDGEIAAYVATGEPLALAGAFALLGRSAPFIESIEGDPGNVIGVSLPLLRRLLAQLDVEITSLWR